MTSSPQDGAGALVESPAPPAFSPLTDPVQGTREPSVNVNLDDTGDREPSSARLPSDPNASQHQPQLVNQTEDVHHQLPITTSLPGAALDSAAMDYMHTSFADAANDVYQQSSTHILMTLARLSATNPPVSLRPSTVRPSQVSISDVTAHEPDAFHNGHKAPPVDTPLESFARIEFPDSVFQMTTYAVIIGRDQRALHQARKDERRYDEYQRRCDEHMQQGLPPPSPPQQDRGKFSKSYVSEEGGMLGPESDGDDNPRPAKKRKTSGNGGSVSGESQLPQEAAAVEQAAQGDGNLIVNRQYISHTPGAAAVNLSALRPSPYHVPFIGIHSPGPNIASRTKSISREHLKIQFNPEQGVFEAIPLHKNGFFCDDVHYKEEKVVLKSGDCLQIKDVNFTFVINGVPRGKTGAEEYLEEEASNRRYSEGGKEMSFEFESNHGREKLQSTSPEEAPVQVEKEDSGSDLSEPADEDMEAPEEDSGVMETIEKDMEEEQQPIKPEMDLAALAELPPMPPKKRGPGRPPKNGIMSKREERLRKKAMMEMAKLKMPPAPPGEPPVKRKVGRPRKHPLPEDAADRPEKRKYKPRKKNGEEGESDPERAVKEKRREKPKTPPLELRREDYSDEQLQKPNKNYGVLIDEVLTAAPDGLTLKQIYKRIQMKYPFYYFTVDTKGWESSVRHNLIGNDAFKKNEETHLWSRVPGIDIDAGKKRKAASPDQATALQNFGQQYQPQNPVQAAAFRSEQASPSKYPPGSAPQHAAYTTSNSPAIPGHPQQFHNPPATSMQQPRQAYPTPGQAHVPAQISGYQNSSAHPPQTVAQGASYASPYATKPLPAAQPNNTPHPTQQYTQPPNGSAAVNGVSRAGGLPGAQGLASGAKPSQPHVPAANAAPLKPAVPAELVKHVINFKQTVAAQLASRSNKSGAVALSAARRGLGLTTNCMVGGTDEGLEKIVLGVFESTKKTLGANQALHPDLLKTLLDFKGRMIGTLTPNLGALKAELLVLSAFDRVLGFAEESTMEGSEAEKIEFQRAETVLIPIIKNMVMGHQKAVANATPTAPGTGPAPAAPTAYTAVTTSLPTPTSLPRATQVPIAAPSAASASPAIHNISPVPQAAIAPASVSASLASVPAPTTAPQASASSPAPLAPVTAAIPSPAPNSAAVPVQYPVTVVPPAPASTPQSVPTSTVPAAHMPVSSADPAAVPVQTSTTAPTPASVQTPASEPVPMAVSVPALTATSAPTPEMLPGTAGAPGTLAAGGPTATQTAGAAPPTATAQ